MGSHEDGSRAARRVPALAAGLFAAALVAGCGTVSKSECQAGDWAAIGERDGRNGEPVTLFDSHAESCARYDLPADRDGWLRGREAGLREYCTPISGFAAGSAGRTYHGVCEGRRGGDFLDAYGIGRDLGAAREAARRAREASERVDGRLSDVEDEIADTRGALAMAEGDERARLADRLRDLEDLRFDLVSDRFDAEREARMAERAADEAEARARDDFYRRFGFSPM
jgi:hypothetical protein